MTTRTRSVDIGVHAIGRKVAAELLKRCVEETGVRLGKQQKADLLRTMALEQTAEDAVVLFGEILGDFANFTKRDKDGRIKLPHKPAKPNGVVRKVNQSFTIDTDIFSLLKAPTGQFEARYDVETGTKQGRSEFATIKNEIFSSLQKLEKIELNYKTIRWLSDSAFMTGVNGLDKAEGGDGLVSFDDYLRSKKFNFELYQKWRTAGNYRMLALHSAIRDALKESITQANSMRDAELLDELCGDLLYEHGLNLFPQKPNQSTGKWENQMFTEWFDEEKNRGMLDRSPEPLTTI